MMKKNILVISFLLFTLILSACGTSATPIATKVSEPAQQVEATSVSTKALFQIIKADGTKFAVTLDALKALPLAQLTVEGKIQEGPKLLDVLALAGITDFTEIALTGSSSPATLTRAQVDDNTILDFNNHGTMKLATTYIPFANWTKDISEITVK
jgi:Cu/Ag efflux protein CusF